MRDASFGQYYPVDSFVHRLDPRTKILLLIVYIVSLYTTKNFYGLALCAAAFLVIALASKIPFKLLFKTVRGVVFLLLFTAVLNLFFYAKGEVVLRWWIIKITKQGIYFTIFLAVRLVLMVMGTSLLTLTTTPVSLTDGLEGLFLPHVLALVISIALRFIPIFSEETARIMNAQKARGAEFEKGNIIKRLTALIPVLKPLLISAFRRSDAIDEFAVQQHYPQKIVMQRLQILTIQVGQI